MTTLHDVTCAEALLCLECRTRLESFAQLEAELATAQAWLNTKTRLEAALGQEWMEARREVLNGGNYGWATMAEVAIEALREQLAEAQRGRQEAEAWAAALEGSE